MKNFISISKLSLIMATAVLLCAGCSKKQTNQKSDKPKQQIILGFSQIGAESAWRTCDTESMKNAAADAGIQMLYANAEQKQENQIKAIRSFIVYRVDVIAFVPIVEYGWDNVLREAQEAHIPVIIVDRQIKTANEDLYAGYFGENTYQEGKNAARFLKRKFSGKEGPLNILEMRGTDNSSAEENRYRGFRDELQDDKRFEIIYSESGDFLRSRGKEITESLIRSNQGFNISGKPINIVFSHNDAMALGMLDVLQKNNIRAGKDVIIVTVDAEQKAIDALKAGYFNCVVECNPKLGPSIMKMTKLLAEGGSIPRLSFIDERVFSEYDDLSKIEPRGY